MECIYRKSKKKTTTYLGLKKTFHFYSSLPRIYSWNEFKAEARNRYSFRDPKINTPKINTRVFLGFGGKMWKRKKEIRVNMTHRATAPARDLPPFTHTLPLFRVIRHSPSMSRFMPRGLRKNVHSYYFPFDFYVFWILTFCFLFCFVFSFCWIIVILLNDCWIYDIIDIRILYTNDFV